MKHKVLVSFIIDEEDSDMAEAEVEGQLSDLMNRDHSTIEDFQIIQIEEIEEEDE